MLPSVALSVRQPWAWAIIYAGKDVENRSWGGMHGYLQAMRAKRGPVCIHAATGLSKSDYAVAKEFMRRIGVDCPAPDELVRGAIIGTVTITDFVYKSKSSWFTGPGALVLKDATPTDLPIPAVGKLGFFEWKQSGGEICDPAKWMRLAEAKPVREGVLL